MVTRSMKKERLNVLKAGSGLVPGKLMTTELWTTKVRLKLLTQAERNFLPPVVLHIRN